MSRRILVPILAIGIGGFNPLTAQAQPAAPLDSLKDPSYWINMCNLLVISQKLPEALNACGRAVSIRPTNPELWRTYTEVQLGLKQYPEALASASQSLRLQANSSAGLLQQCLAAAGMGQATAGLEACDKAIALNKGWDGYSLAIAYREQGRILGEVVKSEQPLQSFDQSLKLVPNSSITQAYRCAALVDLGRGTQAIESCTTALNADRQWGSHSPALALYPLGLAYSLEGKLDLAIVAYDQATAIDPKNTQAWTQQGYTLAQLKRPAEALKSYSKAIEISGTNARALVGQCRVLNQLKQYEVALAACQKSLQGDNNWWEAGPAEAWSQQTHALIGLGKYEDAVSSANRALGIQPNSGEAWNNRAVALFYLKKYPEALESTAQAVQFNRIDGQAWSNRAKFARAAGDLRLARIAYEQATRVEPNNATIWADRSLLLWSIGLVEESLASAQKAVEVDPGLVLGWQNQAVALASLKRYDEALTSYGQALKLTQQNADVWSGLGVVLIQLRRYDQASAALQTALKLNPNSAIAQQALSRLTEWQQRRS